MILLSIIKFAFVSLWANKFRSFLTMISIIIGIFSVIILSAAGNGVKAKVTEFIGNLGPNTVIVLPIPSLDNGDVKSGFSAQQSASAVSSTITNGDIDAINEEIANINGVNAIVIPPGIVTYNDKKYAPFTIGGTPGLADVLKVSLASGRFINEKDIDDKNQVVLMGEATKSAMGINDLGTKIKIGKEEYEIVGFLNGSSQQMFGFDLNNLLFLPYTTAQTIASRTTVDRLLVSALSKDDVKSVRESIKKLFKDRHGEDDVSVLEQTDALKLFDSILGIITQFLLLIASISLLVGGIGIMNIMLVSVTERTKEIGIRKAIGATNFLILLQFLIESILLSAVGAGIAIALTYGVEFAIDQYLGDKAPVHLIIENSTILLAVSISVGIGVIFGLFPAVRAASKNPIEALRYE